MSRQVKMPQKNHKKKSVWYEILIGILSIIFVGVLVGFIGLVIEPDYDYTKTSKEMYYYIIEDKYYNPYDVYEYTAINRAEEVKSDEDMEEIYGYADYCIDSFYYNGLITKDRKSFYKDKMEEDAARMGRLAGLTDRIDRIFR